MISGDAYDAIEYILRENGIPIPEGRGQEKLDEIVKLVRKSKMLAEAKERINNLLRTG